MPGRGEAAWQKRVERPRGRGGRLGEARRDGGAGGRRRARQGGAAAQGREGSGARGDAEGAAGAGGLRRPAHGKRSRRWTRGSRTSSCARGRCAPRPAPTRRARPLSGKTSAFDDFDRMAGKIDTVEAEAGLDEELGGRTAESAAAERKLNEHGRAELRGRRAGRAEEEAGRRLRSRRARLRVVQTAHGPVTFWAEILTRSGMLVSAAMAERPRATARARHERPPRAARTGANAAAHRASFDGARGRRPRVSGRTSCRDGSGARSAA